MDMVSIEVVASMPEFARVTTSDLRSGLTNGSVFILGLVYIMSCLRGECRSATNLLRGRTSVFIGFAKVCRL